MGASGRTPGQVQRQSCENCEQGEDTKVYFFIALMHSVSKIYSVNIRIN